MCDSRPIDIESLDDSDGPIHFNKMNNTNHILFNGIDEYANPPTNVPSNYISDPTEPRNDYSKFIEPSDSTSHNPNNLYDSLQYEIEDVFSDAFERLGTLPLNRTHTDTTRSNRNINTTSRNEFDTINEPNNAINRSTTFRPFRNKLDSFGSSVIFPSFKPLRINFNDICLSHNQKFEDRGDSYIIRNEFPGYTKSDISVNVNGNYLEIVAETSTNGESVQGNLKTNSRSAISYSSTLTIPHGVVKNSITARFRDGLLTVTLPKHNSSINNCNI